MHRLLLVITSLLLTSCLGYPKTIQPIQQFELQSYLGTWYEIARLDHSFERNLNQVTATYSLRDDGGVRVINRGYNVKTNEWEEAEGKAYFVEDKNLGYLKVSFFGPFYGSYVIFDLSDQLAYVSGPDTGYLWLLSRTPQIDDTELARFKKSAEKFGFPVDQLILVEQK